jgi:hypothetical protein
LVKRVGITYPSARLYRDRDAMLAEHPLSVLPCYRPATPMPMPLRTAAVLGGAALVGLGVTPSSAARGTLWDYWITLVGLLAGVALWLFFGARKTGHTSLGLIVAGCVAWVAAPLFGMAGWLLRLPLLRAALVLGGGYLIGLRPGYFPVVRAPASKRFRGVVA